MDLEKPLNPAAIACNSSTASHRRTVRGSRFAALCVLYSWCGCWSDHQFIYGNAEPHLAYSVDHGHFFPGGPNWTVATLAAGPPAVEDASFAPLNLTDAEKRPARRLLAAVSASQVAMAVAAVPEAWGVTPQDRIAIAECVNQRKIQLDALCAALI